TIELAPAVTNATKSLVLCDGGHDTSESDRHVTELPLLSRQVGVAACEPAAHTRPPSTDNTAARSSGAIFVAVVPSSWITSPAHGSVANSANDVGSAAMSDSGRAICIGCTEVSTRLPRSIVTSCEVPPQASSGPCGGPTRPTRPY